MSVITLQEKPKRSQPAPPKEMRQEPEEFVQITGKELWLLTEPGHRKRTAELVREFVLERMNADDSAK